MATATRENFENNKNYKIYETEVQGITVFYHEELYRMAIFTGRRKKSKIYYQYASTQKMLFAIDKHISNHFESSKQKNQIKEDAKVHQANVKVGDVFGTSWGYDQTNRDFFEVIERKSKTRVIIREIGKERTDDNKAFMSGRIRPIPGSYCSDPKIVSIDKYGHLVKADQYGHKAYLIDDVTKSLHISWGG